MISPAALKKWGSKDIAFHPVGTGPFEFVEWKQTEAIVGKKFDGYWKQGYPKIDQITWKPVTENNTRAAMLGARAAVIDAYASSPGVDARVAPYVTG